MQLVKLQDGMCEEELGESGGGVGDSFHATRNAHSRTPRKTSTSLGPWLPSPEETTSLGLGTKLHETDSTSRVQSLTARWNMLYTALPLFLDQASLELLQPLDIILGTRPNRFENIPIRLLPIPVPLIRFIEWASAIARISETHLDSLLDNFNQSSILQHKKTQFECSTSGDFHSQILLSLWHFPHTNLFICGYHMMHHIQIPSSRALSHI